MESNNGLNTDWIFKLSGENHGTISLTLNVVTA